MLIRSVLINKICFFADKMKTTVRELAERTKTMHAYSGRTYIRYVLIRSVEAQGADRTERQARRIVQVSRQVLFFLSANE